MHYVPANAGYLKCGYALARNLCPVGNCHAAYRKRGKGPSLQERLDEGIVNEITNAEVVKLSILTSWVSG